MIIKKYLITGALLFGVFTMADAFSATLCSHHHNGKSHHHGCGKHKGIAATPATTETVKLEDSKVGLKGHEEHDDDDNDHADKVVAKPQKTVLKKRAHKRQQRRHANHHR